MGQYSGLKNSKILVVEDVELNQFLARHIMESWGCQVQIAENGARAVEKIANGHFDLVLMDIQMPVMDGIEATRQIRRLEDTSKSLVPIVALTANATRAEFDSYLRAGMNDCVPKPFEEPVLYQTVFNNIRKSQFMDSPVSSSAAPANEPAKKLYDLSMVEAISGGDQTFVKKMLQLFLDTVPASLTEMREHSAAKRWLELSKVAHKLKSTVDSMTILSLKQPIREIEQNAKAGEKLDSLAAQVAQFISTMESVMKQVREDYPV